MRSIWPPTATSSPTTYPSWWVFGVARELVGPTSMSSSAARGASTTSTRTRPSPSSPSMRSMSATGSCASARPLGKEVRPQMYEGDASSLSDPRRVGSMACYGSCDTSIGQVDHGHYTNPVPMRRYHGPKAALTIALLLISSGARGQEHLLGSSAPLALKPGDVVEVTIWREPDLSGQFVINERGIVTLPMLGPVPVVDIPIDSVRDVLLTEYQKELRNPSIIITPLRRVNILGEVARPGMYEVDPTVSLAGAIALAGGVTPSGDMDKIRIVRESGVISERVGAGATIHSVDILSGDQIVVLQRSWFDRNSTFVVSLVLSISSIVIGLVR
ncbi:MAG: hypothetical protein GEU90_21250 [Gemmatimonas sp.]|nr:hypothetical protein [Gemmatimonas sp.]